MLRGKSNSWLENSIFDYVMKGWSEGKLRSSWICEMTFFILVMLLWTGDLLSSNYCELMISVTLILTLSELCARDYENGRCCQIEWILNTVPTSLS